MTCRFVRICLLAATLAALVAALPAAASSHREAPGITQMPKVDGTDFYVFNSYEAGRSGYVTFIANYVPLQDAYGGPNYFSLDPDAHYRILIDNTGDGVEDITFQFRVNQTLRDIQLPIHGKTISVPLVNVGPITSPNPPVQNVVETYTLVKITGALSDSGRRVQQVLDADTGSARFTKPIDNIGQKSLPDYHSYARQFIHNVAIPGCTNPGRVFVGQRHDGFAVNLGEVFDLVNIQNPLGPRDSQPNTLADKNVTSFVLEVPASCILAQGKTTFGSWTTAALPRNRVLQEAPGFKLDNESGDFVQVSRLSAPLVNELFIGLKDKNKFNGSQPKDDGQFADYVTNPTLPAILELLFGGAGVRAPTNSPRADLVAAFLTGVTGLNALGGPSEMMRLNTAIAAADAAHQNNLGVLGGDNAGFPNGRRPGDDVVDIELRVAMGALCLVPVGCHPADAPSGMLPFTDGTLNDVSQFDPAFPYLKDPLPGSPNGANGISGGN
jgi:hypothetical protein